MTCDERRAAILVKVYDLLRLQRPRPLVLPHSSRSDLGNPDIGRGDARLLDRVGVETALRNHILPLEASGAITPVASPTYATFRRLEPHLRVLLGDIVCRIKPAEAIEAEILTMRKAYMARRAEARTERGESCRGWSGARLASQMAIVCAVVLLGLWLAPQVFFWVLALWTALTLILVTGLRTLAAGVEFRHLRKTRNSWKSRRSRYRPEKPPRISLLVPLFDERDIAGDLVRRLSKLNYPRDRLEVCLILEWGDLRTETALRASDLPGWMRIVHVPRGMLRTKPRAMNYALDFTNGDYVGIYDAEDAPDPEQLWKVVDTFERSPPDVACLQGVLDFYNAKQTWLTRCFTIDYAIWFRLVLPGLVRLGLPIPLGGTTVFFRRSALEALGRWDAHNVTEDADLGLRLARRGYRCAFMPSVTEEEATHAIAPWVRQRSRWIKGYAMTWAVHMRDPLRLLGELGPLRFLSVQILFLGTLSQFVLAPLLWSFWLVPFGLPHPLTVVLPWGAVITLAGLFILAEALTLLVAIVSVATPKRRWLIKWVPLIHLYFPLATLASWKGLWEMVSCPFFWDKTRHGRRSVAAI